MTTPELLDLILQHLPATTLLGLQSVCRTFHIAVSSSPPLRRATHAAPRWPLAKGAAPPPFFDGNFRGRPIFTGLYREWGPWMAPGVRNPTRMVAEILPWFGDQGAAKGSRPLHIDARLLNPLLDRVFPGLRAQHLEHGWTLLTA
ncbi:MAG: F-box protein, partial [Terriglobus roseus]|nr:F-box protein [Terriglobus roseus]